MALDKWRKQSNQRTAVYGTFVEKSNSLIWPFVFFFCHLVPEFTGIVIINFHGPLKRSAHKKKCAGGVIWSRINCGNNYCCSRGRRNEQSKIVRAGLESERVRWPFMEKIKTNSFHSEYFTMTTGETTS